jgi:hypothetical protein
MPFILWVQRDGGDSPPIAVGELFHLEARCARMTKPIPQPLNHHQGGQQTERMTTIPKPAAMRTALDAGGIASLAAICIHHGRRKKARAGDCLA